MVERIRDYRVLSKLGEGGMGTVYLAEDTMLDRKVALKLLNAALMQDSQFVERFKQEAKVQSTLLHPNIVSLHTFFQEDGRYCMVMEYVAGETLKRLIERTGPIPEERALKIFRQMLEAVGHAHSIGIIHRDIKPGNIMVGGGDSVKVMDFGIAKILGDKGMTRTGAKMGTIYYMSPEQVRAAKDLDHRTDIYSLGVTLYEMLTGELPFETETESEFEIMQQIVEKKFPLVSVARSVTSATSMAIDRAIAKTKDERPMTCHEFLHALDGTQEKTAMSVPPQRQSSDSVAAVPLRQQQVTTGPMEICPFCMEPSPKWSRVCEICGCMKR